MTERLNEQHEKDSPRKAFEVAAIGEILWDVFPTGPRFGGAPANFACSMAGLSSGECRVSMVSAVGDDSLGEQALAELRDHRVATDYIARNQFPTGTVDVTLDDEGNASYEFAKNTAWDNLALDGDRMALAKQLDAVCFGTLGQRSDASQKAIEDFVRAAPANALRVFDINLRRPFYDGETILHSLELSNVLKLNEEELPVLMSLCELTGTPIDCCQQLAKRFALRAIALTRGSDGSVAICGDEVSELPGVPTQVVDTVGAGDSFTAAFVLGLLRNMPLAELNLRASEVAAFVCSQVGATPQFPTSLRLRFVRPQ